MQPPIMNPKASLSNFPNFLTAIPKLINRITAQHNMDSTIPIAAFIGELAVETSGRLGLFSKLAGAGSSTIGTSAPQFAQTLPGTWLG